MAGKEGGLNLRTNALSTYGSLIFGRGEEIGLKLEDEQRCKRKDRKSRRYTTAICRTEANGSPRATRQIFSSTWE